MSWHADRDTIEQYLAGRLTEAYACSVEAHLLTCETCRHELATVSIGGTPASPGGPPDLRGRVVHEQTWDRLLDEVDRPKDNLLVRLLSRWVPDHLLRPVLAAPALRNAACIAGLALLGITTLVDNLREGTGGTVLFLIAAPVVPLVGVALAYGDPDELCGEVAQALPYSRFRLLLLRTLAVVGLTVPATFLLSFALPVNLALATLWLLPSLALCAATLALSTWVDSRVAAAALGAGWLVATTDSLRGAALRLTDVQQLLDKSAVFTPEGQLTLLCIAAVAVVVAALRRSTYDSRSAA